MYYNALPSDKQDNAEEIAEQQRQAEEERRHKELAKKKEACENAGNTWNGSSCEKKVVTPSVGSGKWSAYMGNMNWEDAKAKCKSIGMRLPTRTELKAAYEAKLTEPWTANGSYYWTSEECSEASAYNFTVADGIVFNISKTNVSRVRCIR